MLIATARDKAASAYVGDGSNRWPSVHRLDAATLFRLALESAAGGTRLHAVAEQGIPFRDIVDAIGRKLGLPVVSIAIDQAPGHFGPLASLVTLDSPVSSSLTKQRFRWEPVHPGLIADIEQGDYFTP